MDDDYETKYKKYKLKYLELKNQLGGNQKAFVSKKIRENDKFKCNENIGSFIKGNIYRISEITNTEINLIEMQNNGKEKNPTPTYVGISFNDFNKNFTPFSTNILGNFYKKAVSTVNGNDLFKPTVNSYYKLDSDNTKIVKVQFVDEYVHIRDVIKTGPIVSTEGSFINKVVNTANTVYNKEQLANEPVILTIENFINNYSPM